MATSASHSGPTKAVLSTLHIHCVRKALIALQRPVAHGMAVHAARMKKHRRGFGKRALGRAIVFCRHCKLGGEQACG
jgi:hypothetical protein